MTTRSDIRTKEVNYETQLAIGGVIGNMLLWQHTVRVRERVIKDLAHSGPQGIGWGSTVTSTKMQSDEKLGTEVQLRDGASYLVRGKTHLRIRLRCSSIGATSIDGSTMWNTADIDGCVSTLTERHKIFANTSTNAVPGQLRYQIE
jgi:hypothetical protein